jgi:hypothetical protein
MYNKSLAEADPIDNFRPIGNLLMANPHPVAILSFLGPAGLTLPSIPHHVTHSPFLPHCSCWSLNLLIPIFPVPNTKFIVDVTFSLRATQLIV